MRTLHWHWLTQRADARLGAVAWALCACALACEPDAPPSSGAADAGERAVAHSFAGKLRLWHGFDAVGPVADAAVDAAADAAPAPADAGGEPQDPQLTRGEYIVRHAGGCMECHTPRLASGRFDESRLLSGVENLIDLDPQDPGRGMLNSHNLTPDRETGLGKLSDAQIKEAFQHGRDREHEVLHWTMPYWIYANMSDEDADAVVAFLRSIPPVEHQVPEEQPNAVNTDPDAKPYELPIDRLPQPRLDASDPDYASAERGRYLASGVSPCLLCHTPAPKADAAVPIDVELAFTGRRQFVPVRLGTQRADDKPPPMIESYNLTPGSDGIGTWTARDVAKLLTRGVGPDALPVCDPMPSADGSAFRGLTDDDALDLGHYFTNLPKKNTGHIARCCTACHNPEQDADAGEVDAGL